MMPTSPGERVGERCSTPGCRFTIRVLSADAAEARKFVKQALDQHKCVQAPQGWPPIAGDVWVGADDSLWAVRAGSDFLRLDAPRSGLDEERTPESFLEAMSPAQLAFRVGKSSLD